MSSIPVMHEEKQLSDLSPARVVLMATGAGLAVASIYYSQPMLGVLAGDIHEDATAVGWMPTLTQLGYALGILLLAPLGDRIDRRRVILVKSVLLCAALMAMAVAPSVGWLLAASLLVGLMATLAQDIVPPRPRWRRLQGAARWSGW